MSEVPGSMRVIAVISKREVADKILAHVRLPVDPEDSEERLHVGIPS